jgi:hypothetical protein
MFCVVRPNGEMMIIAKWFALSIEDDRQKLRGVHDCSTFILESYPSSTFLYASGEIGTEVR